MKKVGLLILALVIALGALGAGYAYWTQNLYVNTTVNTGELEATINDVAVQAPNPDPYGANVTTNIVGIDTLNIVAVNVYPGFSKIINFQIQNTGTIPLYITPEVSATYYYGPSILIADDLQTLYPNSTSYGDDTPVGRTSVINPGQELNCKVVITMDSSETGHENETFTWNVTFVAHQANQP